MTIRELYPEHIDRDLYASALAQCIISGDWLLNNSGMDVFFEIDGFEIRIPAGNRIRCTDWAQVQQSVGAMGQEEFYGCERPVNRYGFKFLSDEKLYIYDSLLVFCPDSARACGGYYGPPERTLEEHIALINAMKLEKTTIIAKDISFLPRCPSLKELSIQHAHGQETPLDFSPLYEMPEIRSLSIAAPNMGLAKGPAIHIDFTKLRGLRRLALCTNEPFNYPLVPTLETLWLANDKRHSDMSGISCSQKLKSLQLLQCGTKSLNGIRKYPLQRLDMSYLRGMADISALSDCAQTLRSLSIEACGKIKDFSCLYDLVNLEHLMLRGSNTLPSLDFLRRMPKLKTFVFSMSVEDGDLKPCLEIPYTSCDKIKRHYNLKEKDLPKNLSGTPFEIF